MNWYTSMDVPRFEAMPVAPTAAPPSRMATNSGLVMKRKRSTLPSSFAIGVPLAYFSAGMKPGRSRTSGSRSVETYTRKPADTASVPKRLLAFSTRVTIMPWFAIRLLAMRRSIGSVMPPFTVERLVPVPP